MIRSNRKSRFGRPLLWLCTAGLAQSLNPLAISSATAFDNPRAEASAGFATWMDALKDTARSGRPSLILVTSSALDTSLAWAGEMRALVADLYGSSVNLAELRAETDPQRVSSLNVKSIPTLLLYRSDGNGGLKLAGYREGAVGAEALATLVGPNQTSNVPSLADHAPAAASRKVVRVQRASVSMVAEAPAAGSSNQAQNTQQDAQVAAATHHFPHSSAQSSPQNYAYEPPSKQMPPAPVKTPPSQPTPPPTTYQAPPPQQTTTQPVYAAPPQQPVPQPVYAYVPQQPVYAAPPTAPLMVQPPAGQVVVQPAPLNVTVAPSPPPQVTYMTPAMAPMPQPMQAIPQPNAFTAPPPAQPAMAMAPPGPAYGAAPPSMPEPGYGPAYGAGAPAAGIGSLAMGMMLTNPNILDRILGGFGRLLAERSYPRIRMNPESPSLFSAPAGMGGFVGINPAMAMAPTPASPNPLQTYMAVPNGGGGGGDATEAYLKAYIALCREKGVAPNLPGWEPPAPPPPTGPVPSPQDVGHKKKGWFSR